ncbi:MAG: LysR family transcriptional regulator [Burkholderiales bacterium]|nr:LysR family transcriptional regulator [Burkholderiales bacterium]
MKLSLDALQAMDAIERKGSFAAAAAELHRVPSALTYTVRKLEQDLGVALFDRSGHRARLTAAGEELMREGRQLLRAAGEIECRVKRVATGWETELRIAVDIVIPAAQLFPLIADFYAEESGTRIRLAYEVLAGTWDALASGRAELALGVSGDAPAGGGYAIRMLGYKDFVFAVAPGHPLASLPEPLKHEQIVAHRAVAIGDSSRNLQLRSVGLLTGQDVLTVPDLTSKVAAQAAGLGCGYLPTHAAAPMIKSKHLLVKEVEEVKPVGNLYYAWRSREKGKALRWFLKRLEDQDVRASLLRY